MKGLRQILILALLLLTVASCQFSGDALVDSDQLSWDSASSVALEPGLPVGQTFVARHGGLTGVELFLIPDMPSSRFLTLHLRSGPQAEVDLATATLQLLPGAEPGFYRFTLSPLETSHGQYYYAFIEGAEPGISVALGPGERYLDGAAHQGHQPLDAQTVFRLAYAPPYAALDLLRAAWGWLGLLAAAGLLFVVPGWALLAWLWRGRPLSWAETLGLAVGISLALYPVLFLWTDLIGLHLGAGYAWLPVASGTVALLWRHRSRLASVLGRWPPTPAKERLLAWARSEALWPDLTLLALLGLVFGVRLLVVRSLDAPMWGDSYHHTVIVQLLVDNGGLFDSWAPYAPYESLTVHYGFHALAALFSWLTRIDAVKATLLAGQVINGLASLSLYPLAVRLADGRRWAGVGAVLVAGLLSPMPGFYTNWGRYAQLAGQAILPTAIWFSWEAAQARSHARRLVPLAGFSLAGMALCYYRMPLFFAPFVGSWLLVEGFSSYGRRIGLWLRGVARLAFVAVIAALLLLPWGLHLLGGQLTGALAEGVSQQAPLQEVLAEYQAWNALTVYVPLPLLVAALLGLAWALVRRRWIVTSVVLWVLFLALWVAGRLISFPAANMVQNFAVLIGLYIPASLLVGWLTGALAEWAQRRRRTIWRWLWGLAVLTLALAGTVRQVRVIQPQHIMVTRPDMQAMQWIRQNVATQASFLVEGFRIYEGRTAVGSDAGWWIPLLAGRENTMPPQYALVAERPTDPGYSQQVVQLVANLETAAPASPQGLQYLCAWGISHIYVGQGQGKVGLDARQLFSPETLATASPLDLVYQRDRVYIFALKPQACDQAAP
jgi:hypothetical protein